MCAQVKAEGRPRFEGIVRLLRFFAELRNFSVVDRIANTLSPEAVEVALYDAIRAAKSIAASGRLDEDTSRALESVGASSVEDLIPGEEEVAVFLGLVRRRLSVARVVAIRALAR